jgi:hypothetical protein
MLESLARAKEYGLVLTADNVQRNVGFMCQCCGCCCNLMLGVAAGYTNTVVTSNTSRSTRASAGCEVREKCPAEAIAMVPIPNRRPRSPRTR